MFDNIRRGGQVWDSKYRQFRSVIRKYLIYSIPIVVALTTTITLKATNTQTWDYGLKYWESHLESVYLFNRDNKTTVTDEGTHQKFKTTWGAIHRSSFFQDKGNKLKQVAITSLVSSIVFYFLVSIVVMVLINRYGAKMKEAKVLRGTRFGTLKEIKALVKIDQKKYHKKSRLTIHDVPLPPGAENSNIGVIGTPGTGKSQTISEYITQARKKKIRALIYDYGGAYTRSFYRPGVDKILNSLDERSVNWGLWSEGADESKYRLNSSILIPENARDPYWSNAARIVLETFLDHLDKLGNHRMESLMDIILRTRDEEIAKIVKDTEAMTVLNMDIEKLAGSIRSVLSTNVYPLKFFRSSGEDFSFNEWVNSDDDSCVFIPVFPADSATLAPIIALFFSHFVSAMLSVDPVKRPQFDTWMIIDELATINKIQSLPDYLANARKNGGNALLGWQSFNRLKTIYGNDYKTVSNLLRTNYIFASGYDDAEEAAKIIGRQDVLKGYENNSISDFDKRDSTNIGQTEQRDVNLLSPTQINDLPDLTYILKFGRGYPVIEKEIKYKKYPDNNPPIERFSAGKEISVLLEEYKAQHATKKRTSKNSASNTAVDVDVDAVPSGIHEGKNNGSNVVQMHPETNKPDQTTPPVKESSKEVSQKEKEDNEVNKRIDLDFTDGNNFFD